MAGPTFGSNPTDFPLNWENATQAVRYTGAKIGASQNGCDKITTTAQFPLGIIQNDPKLNQGATIRPAGRSLAVAGAAITLGARLVFDSSGRVITYTRGGTWSATAVYTIGVALSAAANANELIEVLICPAESQT
jgi:hypothetical protein